MLLAFSFFFFFSTRRCGVVTVKLGVIPQWTKEGQKFYTTLLQVHKVFNRDYDYKDAA